MANTIDYSISEATDLTLTNVKPILLDEKGNEIPQPIKVQLYRVNQWVTIPRGDSLKITVTESEEVAYYNSLATEGELTIA